MSTPMSTTRSAHVPVRLDEPPEGDYSQPVGLDFEALAHDSIPIRSLVATDFRRIAAIDRKITGRDRSTYFERKVAEALGQSAVRVSLVAELDATVVGFVMARVDFGEFGQADPEAVLDTIGVDPGYRHRGIGGALVSQLLTNLAGLRVERVRSEMDWNDHALIAFLEGAGFRPSQRLVFRRRLG